MQATVVAAYSFSLALAQNPFDFSLTPEAIATALDGLVPENQVEFASTALVGLVNSTAQSLLKLLLEPGIDPRKLFQPENYYSYGRSPPVYPSRMCRM
jgi:hypothetical protein